MNTRIIILSVQLFVLTTNIFCQDSNEKLLVTGLKFESDYQLFLEKQKTPLLNAQKELFALDGITWQRDLGESEFYLTPSFRDKKEIKVYEERINNRNGKSIGICKLNCRIVKVTLTPQSVRILDDFGVKVPWYKKNYLLVLLPQLDIDSMIQKGIDVIYVINNKESVNVLLKNNADPNRSVIWSEGFEGAFPGSNYNVGDDNPASGEDYWDDVSCSHHGGGKSIWCADEGDQPMCVNYDDNMDSYVEIANSISLSGYTNPILTYWVKYEMEPGVNHYDYLKFFVSLDGGNYTPVIEYDDNSQGSWLLSPPYAITNCSEFGWLFKFHSNGSIHNYFGAYVDDMEITAAASYLTFPFIEYIEINDIEVDRHEILDKQPTSDIEVHLSSLDDTFKIKLRGENDDQDMAPPNLSNLTLSFEQYTSNSDKNLITINNQTSSDLTMGKYYGTEAMGGDGNAEYVIVEGTDNNGWNAGESNDIVLDVKPKDWGPFVIECRMGLPTDDTWENFIHDPPTGYCPTCDEETDGIDPIRFYSYFIIVDVLPIEPPFLEVNPQTNTVDFNPGSFPESVTSNVDWTVSESCDWLSCDPTSGNNTGFFNITYDANGTYLSRSCDITVNGGGITRIITVVQNGLPIPILEVYPQVVEVEAPPGSFPESVTSNVDWTVSESCDWLSCDPTSGNNTGFFNITYDANGTYLSRSCDITVNGGGITRIITFVQNGLPIPILEVYPQVVEVEAPPGSFLEFVTSNVDWTVLEDCDWLSCEPTSGSNINYFTVIYNDNGTSLTRICNITVSHGIIAQSITVTQNPWPNQLDDIKLISHLKIFPNPANNKLNIAGDSLQIQNFDFVISNILGEVIIESGNNILNRIQIDVSTWPKGIYLVMIKTKDGILTRKIVITKYD